MMGDGWALAVVAVPKTAASKKTENEIRMAAACFEQMAARQSATNNTNASGFAKGAAKKSKCPWSSKLTHRYGVETRDF